MKQPAEDLLPAVRAAARQWGLHDASVRPLGGGTANRNFLLSSPAGRHVLRLRNPRYAAPEALAYYHGLMQHLHRAGLQAPYPLPTVDGKLSLVTELGTLELYPCLDGEPFDETQPAHRMHAAEALRRFHQATASFDHPYAHRQPRIDSPEMIRQGLEEIRAQTTDPEQLRILEQLFQWHRRLVEALPDERFWALPCQVIHGDFHPANVTISPTGLNLFDFDNSSWQPRLRDLADAMLFFCGRREGRFDASTIVTLTKETTLDPARHDAFLQAYGPLTSEEAEALRWVVVARWIYCRVDGRRKLPPAAWPAFVTNGVLPLLGQIEEGLLRPQKSNAR
ncbi:MAG TPA: phosphotransferase [Candidatus Sumerlaeota bacterium]|nr:phosphotransferase [Candidatus Sumerlaeota bacterium]